MNTANFAESLINAPSERSVLSEILKSILEKNDDNDLNILFDYIPHYKKYIYEIIYNSYVKKINEFSDKEKDCVDKKVLDRFLKESSYLKKLRIAKYFSKLNENRVGFSPDIAITLLDSNYSAIRQIGYDRVCLDYNTVFLEKILNNREMYDDDILNILLRYNLTERTSIVLKDYLDGFYTENESDDLLFEEVVTRNRILVKLYKTESEKIEGLRVTDSISYVYIKKNLKQYVETNYLYETYYSFSYRKLYLIRWFAELGNWEVVDKIYHRELESPSPSMAQAIF